MLAADAELPEGWQRIKIARQTASGIKATDSFALIRNYSDETITPDIWIPSEVLALMNAPLKLNAQKNAFVLRLEKPGEKLNAAALKQLAPNALDLNFAARSEDGRQHLNISYLEDVTGVSYILSKNKKNPEQSTLLVGPAALIKKNRAKTPKPDLGKLEHPFNLIWDHVLKENPDLSAEERIKPIDVLSPTWFALTDEKGGMSNKADVAYVRAAHKHGYRVWALVSNGFDKARTTKFLNDAKAQDIFIARLLAYATIYGFDGINVDFESVDNNDAKKLTAFVRKLASAAHAVGLTVSIDIMIPTKWSTCYERTELSKLVDYVAVMTYDEHWRTAPKAGSTASMPWVRQALANTLADIPANKLLLGIPLYTREWEETKNKSTGKVTVKSKTFAMVSSDVRIQETKSEKRWLEDIGQHYFDYVSGDKKYRVWVEDERSVMLRLKLASDNKLAGAAFWRKGFEKPEIWTHVEKNKR